MYNVILSSLVIVNYRKGQSMILASLLWKETMRERKAGKCSEVEVGSVFFHVAGMRT